MKKENKSRYAILGMLFDKPRSGYEIRESMKISTAHFWQESDASIYPMLKKLESEKKVTAAHILRGKRASKMYKITSAGKHEFLDWMSMPAQIGTWRDELLLKLFFGATINKEEVLKHLEMHQNKLQEFKRRLEYVEKNILSTVQDKHPHKFFWVMTLNQGKAYVNAQLQWVQDSIKEVNAALKSQ